MSKRVYSAVVFFTCIILWIVSGVIRQNIPYSETINILISVTYILSCGGISVFLYHKFVDKD